MAGLMVEIPTTNLPVTLAEMKGFLRVDDGMVEDDMLITTLISAATGACETFTRRSIMQKGYLQTLDCFPYFNDTALSQLSYPPNMGALPRYSTTFWNYSQMIKLFRPPLVSVDRISYFDSGLSSFVDLVPQPLPWYPQTVYNVGNQVADNNNNIQQLTMPITSPLTLTGKSGIAAPGLNAPAIPAVGNVGWNKILLGITTEAAPATSVWQNVGPMPSGQFGAFIADKTSEPGRVFPGINSVGSGGIGFWPSVLYLPNAVQIHFTAGYGTDTTSVPDAIRQAIMQLVANLYETREPVKEDQCTLPPHVKMMLYPYTVMDFTPTRG